MEKIKDNKSYIDLWKDNMINIQLNRWNDQELTTLKKHMTENVSQEEIFSLFDNKCKDSIYVK